MLTFRYPAATIVLMTLIVAVILVILNKANAIFALAAPIAVILAISYALAALAWAVMFGLRRAGVHRMAAVQTWTAPK